MAFSRRWWVILLLSLNAVFICVIVAVNNQSTITKQESVVFGTRAVLTIRDIPATVAATAIADVFAHLDDMQARFYPWQAGELRRINQRIAAADLPITVSTPMASMLETAKKYTTASQGLFNPAVGGLVSLWGFHLPDNPITPPAAADILAWRQNAPSMDDLRLSKNTIIAAPKTMLLDFGGVGKGVALDQARDILRQAGVRNALINIGGSVLAMGKNGDKFWRVALIADGNKPPLAVIALKDGEAVSTSGDSERFFIYTGKRRYHHILNPRTGEPAMARQTAIVISDDTTAAGAISDAAATALVIANEYETQQIMTALELTMVWQVGEGSEYQTPALKMRLAE